MNILCLVAHPDDETILCGGTLARLAASGANVHIACLTRGEGGEPGEPPLTDREHIGQVREGEMVCAVGKLGGKSLTFLGYIDPLVGPEDKLFAPQHDPLMLGGQIAAAVKQFKVDAVLTHGSNGEYGHPAHVLMHQMTLAAVAALRKEQASSAPLLYTFAANFPDHPRPRLANADDPADLVLDISPYFDKKEAAAMCHKTQHALFVRRPSQELGRPVAVREALLTVESLHRIFGSTDDELTQTMNDER